MYLLEFLEESNVWQHFQPFLVPIRLSTAVFGRVIVFLVPFVSRSPRLLLVKLLHLSEITVHRQVPLALVVHLVRYLVGVGARKASVRCVDRATEEILLGGSVSSLSLCLL